MKRTAEILRTLQLVAQNYHNLASGKTFLADHSFLGEVYDAAADAYDSVIERCIGLHDYGQQELNEITKLACNNSCQLPYSGLEQALHTISSIEKLLCDAAASDMKGASEGTKNLLAQLADDSEVRQYKLKQRLQK